MPTIPLLRPSQTPATPAPVLTPSGTSSAIAGTGRALEGVADAAQLELIPLDAIDSSGGLEALGQGAQNVGGLLAHAAEVRRKTVDQRDIFEAELAMSEKLGAFEALKRDIDDENLWAENWESVVRETEAELLGESRNLSPEARNAISMRLARWGSNGRIAAEKDAFLRSEERRIDARDANLMLAAKRGDQATGHMLIESDTGFTAGEKVIAREKFDKELAANAKEAGRQTMYSWIMEDPLASQTLEAAAKSGDYSQLGVEGASATDVSSWLSFAQSWDHKRHDNDLGAMQNLIASGAVSNIDQLYAQAGPTLTPVDLEKFKGLLESRRRNGPPDMNLYNGYYKAVDQWTPAAGHEAALNLSYAIENDLPSQQAGPLLAKLKARTDAEYFADDLDPLTEITRQASSISDNLLKGGAFGQYEAPGPSPTNPKYKVMVTDYNALMRAQSLQSTFDIQLRKKIEADPEAFSDPLKVEEQARLLLRELGIEPTLANADQLLSPPAQEDLSLEPEGFKLPDLETARLALLSDGQLEDLVFKQYPDGKIASGELERLQRARPALTGQGEFTVENVNGWLRDVPKEQIPGIVKEKIGFIHPGVVSLWERYWEELNEPPQSPIPSVYQGALSTSPLETLDAEGMPTVPTGAQAHNPLFN